MDNKQLRFDATTHTYWLDGEKPNKLISVTQLMQKHGLAPNYAGISTEVLNAKAERGSLIHAEIEEYNLTGFTGFTAESASFAEYIETHEITVDESEKRVHNDIVAGTIDLVMDFVEEGKQPKIADIKTTYTVHRDAVSWQLSIYLYLYLELDLREGPCEYNNFIGQCYWFNKDSMLEVIDIKLKPYEEVARLMECERNGELYKQSLTIPEIQLVSLYEAEKLIKEIEAEKSVAEERAKELREALMKAMEENGVKQFENDNIKITYVDPQQRKSIDSTRLKKDHPEIAAEYEKITNVKASLRITIKE